MSARDGLMSILSVKVELKSPGHTHAGVCTHMWPAYVAQGGVVAVQGRPKHVPARRAVPRDAAHDRIS